MKDIARAGITRHDVIEPNSPAAPHSACGHGEPAGGNRRSLELWLDQRVWCEYSNEPHNLLSNNKE